MLPIRSLLFRSSAWKRTATAALFMFVVHSLASAAWFYVNVCRLDTAALKDGEYKIEVRFSEGNSQKFYMEFSTYPDFSFAYAFTYTAPGTKSTKMTITLDQSQFVPGTYYYRAHSATTHEALTCYPTATDPQTITFGTKVENDPGVDPTEYSEIDLQNGNSYSISSDWVRSIQLGNYWLKDPATPNNAYVGCADVIEWPVHGIVHRNGIILTPFGGGIFNYAWLIDKCGIGIYRTRLADGTSLPPIRVMQPADHPFVSANDTGYNTGVMYYLGEDSDGTIYFTSTHDLAYGSLASTSDEFADKSISVFALDLSPEQITADEECEVRLATSSR